jgi:hypothetical protein
VQPRSFDELARAFAASRSRRDFLKVLAATVAPRLLARRSLAAGAAFAASGVVMPTATQRVVSATGTASVQVVCDCDGDGFNDVSVWVNFECPGTRCFGLTTLRCGDANLEASLAEFPADVVASVRGQIRAGDACMTCPPLAPFCPGCDIEAMLQARADYQRWLGVYHDLGANADDRSADAHAAYQEGSDVWTGWFQERVLDLIPESLGGPAIRVTVLESDNIPSEVITTGCEQYAQQLENAAIEAKQGFRRGLQLAVLLNIVFETVAGIGQLAHLIDIHADAVRASQESRQASLDSLGEAIAARDRLNALEAACHQSLQNAALPVRAALLGGLVRLQDELEYDRAIILELLASGDRALALSQQASQELSGAGAEFAHAEEVAHSAEGAELSEEQEIDYLETMARGFRQMAAGASQYFAIGGELRRIELLQRGPYPHCAPGQVPELLFGFATLAGALGDTMGEALECQHTDPASGDTLQTTSMGLAIHRATTNVSTFTNGSEHWALTETALVYWVGDGDDPPPDAQPVATT